MGMFQSNYQNLDFVLHFKSYTFLGGRRAHDRTGMLFGVATTCAYHDWSCEFEPRSWRGV